MRGLAPRQKAILAAALIAVAGTLWLFVSLLGRSGYQVLYSGLDPDESNTILKRLANEHIPAESSADGKTLSVPGNRLEKARLDMAAEGFPQTGRLGFEIFDQSNWGQSDFAEKVNYQRALEGELERTIQDLSDVEAVRVNLVMPRESLYSDQERPAKASVLVRTRNGGLSEHSLRAITYLVASAVDTLTPSNVTVVDADGNVPLVLQGGVKPDSPEGSSEYEKALDQKLEATLTPVLGAGHFVARATVEYDQASSENTQEVYDPNDSVVLNSQVTTDGAEVPQDSGIPGAASNVPQAQARGAPNPNNSPAKKSPSSGKSSVSQEADSSTANQGLGSGETSDTKSYEVGRTVTHTVKPPGAIRRITAAILVDDTTESKIVKGQKTTVSLAPSPQELKQIQDLASAVLGLDSSRGDEVTVENIPFTVTPLQPAPALHGLQRVRPFLNQYGVFVRYFFLGLLAVLIFMFVLRPLINQLGTTPRALPEPSGSALPTDEAAGGALPSVPALAAAAAGPAQLPVPSGQKEPLHQLRESLATKVSKTPAVAGRLVEGWIREDEE